MRASPGLRTTGAVGSFWGLYMVDRALKVLGVGGLVRGTVTFFICDFRLGVPAPAAFSASWSARPISLESAEAGGEVVAVPSGLLKPDGVAAP